MPTRTTRVERFHVSLEQLSDVLDLLNDADQPNDDRGVVAVTVERPLVQASAPHATETDVRLQLALGGEINDSAALAIAAWYQSPRGVGQTFTQLASGQPVPVDELTDAIASELVGGGTDPYFAGALEALARWAEGVGADAVS